MKSKMLRDQSSGLVVHECVVHLLKPRGYVGWFEVRGPKASFQNLEKAFAGREKLIHCQKCGHEVGILGFICTAGDDPRDEAFEISC
jgi:hypothetical protein